MRPSQSMVAMGAWLILAAAGFAQGGGALRAPGSGAGQAGDAAAVATCVERAKSLEALNACQTIVAQPCLERPGGETTAGMIGCMDRSRAAWDAALNAAYAKLMHQESPGQRAALRAAQRAWIAWRDASCAYEASAMEGGSLARVIGAGCVAETTAERAIALVARLRGPEFN